MEVMYGSPSVSYTHLDVYKRQVVYLQRFFFIKENVFFLANDNSRKFKQNQIMFRIQPWIVEFSIPIGVGDDRLRERGSLPATFYVLTRVFSLSLIHI